MKQQKFQSPSLRGSGRFCNGIKIAKELCSVSIPFIAGQWSLPVASTHQSVSLSPIVSIPFIAGQWSLHLGFGVSVNFICFRFNPLHCGAVVASKGELP